MINRKTTFRAEVFAVTNIGTASQRQSLIDDIREKQASSASMDYSNPGCFRIERPCKDISWLLDEINVLLVDAVNFYIQEDTVFNSIKKSKDAVVHYWANVNQPGSRNTLHTHKEDDFSCVYYLQGTDSGDLRFPNPANLLGDCSKTSPFTRDFLFSPKDGDLILWPSWLPHEVEPNLSSRERINLAFNFRIAQ